MATLCFWAIITHSRDNAIVDNVTLNPYEPPTSPTERDATVASDVASDVVTIKVAPFYLDAIDLIGGQIAALIYLWIPAGLIAWITNSIFNGFVTLLLIAAAFLLFTIRSARISSAGIRFVRILGQPRFLAWQEIVDVSEAPRLEVLIHGWSVPRFPPREITSASTTMGHFRIQWTGGWLYFPPAEVGQFRKLVQQHIGRAESCGAPKDGLHFS